MSRFRAGVSAAAIILAAAAVVAGTAQASPITLTADLSKNAPAGAVALDFSGAYNPAQPAQTLHLGTATISFSGGSRLFTGSVGGVAAAPYTSTGPDTKPYLSAEPGGAVTIAFAAPQNYFGLLWGSVDGYNHLTFYDGAVKVASFSGADVTKSADGNQGFAGTFFVGIDFAGANLFFNRVVATSDSPAFEFDAVTTAAVPEPATLALLATGFTGLVMFRRRRRRAEMP